MKKIFVLFLLAAFTIPNSHAQASNTGKKDLKWLSVVTPNKETRTQLVNLGVSIEQVIDGISYGFAPQSIVNRVKKSGLEIQSVLPAELFSASDFPPEDAIYHNYAEMNAEIDRLATAYPSLVHKFSIGKSTEGRDIWGIRINPHVDDAETVTMQPGIIFMGGHHAREHLSMDIPLLYAKHIIENAKTDPVIAKLVDTRDIYFIPMVNPDGSEYDISDNDYKMWRKNRRPSPAGPDCAGVDLNRNYGFGWNTGGSSDDPCSDIYMGPKAFSEPETQAIKAFVESRPNVKILLSFHSYSELILYPWGHTYDPVTNTRDHSAFETMARTMADWNGYTPEQSSELYIASGDTTDWSYGQLGIFSFTFELSPRDSWGGAGFYPGAGAIQTTFNANLRPVLYLIDLADDPHRSVAKPETTLFFGSGFGSASISTF